MSEYDYEEELQDAFEADPVTTTAAIAAAMAQQVAGQAQYESAANNAAMIASQTHLTAAAVDREMTERYGNDWDTHRADVVATFERNPHLLPESSAILDPVQMRQSFEDAYKIARADRAVEDQRTRWAQVMNAPSGRLDL